MSGMVTPKVYLCPMELLFEARTSNCPAFAPVILHCTRFLPHTVVIAPVLSSPSLAEKAEAMKLGPGILAGVIARSAGAWSE